MQDNKKQQGWCCDQRLMDVFQTDVPQVACWSRFPIQISIQHGCFGDVRFLERNLKCLLRPKILDPFDGCSKTGSQVSNISLVIVTQFNHLCLSIAIDCSHHCPSPMGQEAAVQNIPSLTKKSEMAQQFLTQLPPQLIPALRWPIGVPGYQDPPNHHGIGK